MHERRAWSTLALAVVSHRFAVEKGRFSAENQPDKRLGRAKVCISALEIERAIWSVSA